MPHKCLKTRVKIKWTNQMLATNQANRNELRNKQALICSNQPKRAAKLIWKNQKNFSPKWTDETVEQPISICQISNKQKSPISQNRYVQIPKQVGAIYSNEPSKYNNKKYIILILI